MKFDKYYDVYEEYSLVQKKVAKNLVDFIEKNKLFDKNISRVFEIGCGTGILTREYLDKIKIKNLILNDIFDVKKFLSKINYNLFLKGDINNVSIPRADLIISSSVFQWIENLETLFKELVSKSDNLAFSIYISGNLLEIKKHFGVSLNYCEAEEIEKILKKYFKNIVMKRETIVLNFERPIQVLKHLKYTGVTGLKKPAISNIRSFKENKLTYEIAYFYCEN